LKVKNVLSLVSGRGTFMFHLAFGVIAKAQHDKARTHHGSGIDFDVSKRTTFSFQTVPMTLKEGTYRHGKLLWNIMSLFTILVRTDDASQKLFTDGGLVHVWLYSNQPHVASNRPSLRLL